jgi:crotonobetainyl-CoA:carnitine CoA-transferase CaiB-like acyl-CoA transferase
LWPLLDDAFSRFSTGDVLQRLDAHDVLCAPVLDYDAVLADEQVRHNDSVVTVAHPTLGDIAVVRSPVRLSDTDTGAHSMRPPPLLGQDTDDVLTSAFALTADELAELRAQRVIG